MLQTFSPRSPLVNIYKLKISCPVCGKKDNCAVSEDRRAAYCRRVPSAKRGNDGGFWHWLADAPTNEFIKPRTDAREAIRTLPRASVEQRDKVYSDLLFTLSLESEHYNDLTKRGLSDEAIKRAGFASVPRPERFNEITATLSRHHDLCGIPGFWKAGSVWKAAKMPEGYFVPCRDRYGRVQGLQIRRLPLADGEKNKYIWLSSKGYSFGASISENGLLPIHVEQPERIALTGSLFITEGITKAVTACHVMKESAGGFIAVAGTSAFKESLASQLKAAWSNLSTVIVAYDGDYENNFQVKTQLARLLSALRGLHGVRVYMMKWATLEKGIDDFLIAEIEESKGGAN